jgi:Protein of unknown function (DUF3025)
LAYGLETIDGSAPWLAPFKNLVTLAQTQSKPQELATDQTQVCELLNSFVGAPIRFVPQSHLPPQESYERYIYNSKQCPTRDGLHDFFNGLCWIQFPQTKTRLNQLQAQQIEQIGSVTSRGPVRDALTVFDENAAFLFAPQELWQALLAKDWHRLFVTLRPLWADAQLVLFGHALMEKLVTPRKAITAHVYISNHLASWKGLHLSDIDALIAADLSAEKLATKPFAPLPVLGVPTWWAANEDPSFYTDTQVFR